jgi:hypothetical protein
LKRHFGLRKDKRPICALTIDGFTTRDLAPFERAGLLLSLIRDHLQFNEFEVVWGIADGSERRVICKNIAAPLVLERWQTGAVSLEDVAGHWQLRVEWSKSSAQMMRRKYGFLRQNEFTLRLSTDCPFTQQFIDSPSPFVTALYDVAQCNYMVVRDPRSNVFGIGASATFGLVDLYWINAFGPPYVEMFGREKLLGLPSFSRQEMPDGGVLLQMTKTPVDPGSDDWRALREEAVQFLGSDFFCQTAGQKRQGGQFSLFNPLKLLGNVVRNSRTPSAQTPELDWTQIIV